MINLNNPIFLLGTQRSGTTLLTRILSTHPKLYIQNELPMEGMFDGEITQEIMLARIVNKISSMHKVELPMEDSSELIWGWKDPLLTYKLEELSNCFSDSKYVLIIRDARGVVNSYMDNRWGLGTTAYTGALRWKHEVALQLAFADKMKDKCLVLRYEDLVQDLPSTLKSLCQFIGVEYSSEMLDFHQRKLEFRENRENRNTAKPADPSNIGKWRQTLTKREIALVEHVAAEEMHSMKYELESTPISPSWLELAYYRIHQKIIGEIQLQYKWKYKDKLKSLGLVK
ncbi:sulfotransferase [Paraglaciecola aquimarina]|uniref:Sulfotransferase n=1 Tax=Paraglaciecola algarum TaxID=3050085 RepID=A0ABS9D5N9_9ALTE|nr:sulfotransferase [Paraglaciecola sp. G1-23]MCF2947747.1 sulfotransferase [Paraglaciecola sp. G1-23]